MLAIGGILIIIGLAGATTGNPLAIGLLIIGAILFLLGNLQINQLDSHFELTDYIIMLVLAIVALFLGLFRVWDWRYAFIGDEWSFFTLAQELLHKNLNLAPFHIHDGNGYHTIFSSLLQSGVMELAGENVFGWRLSSLLPMALSVPALYIFLRWVMRGRNAATVGAGMLAASHLLLSFSMTGYNNTQALLPLTLGLGAFAFARYHFSAFRYLILGIALGSGFLVYGLGRLALIPLALLILLYIRDSLHRLTLSRLFIFLGFIGTAAPTLFNLANWQSLLSATPLQSESGSLSMAQILKNIVDGFQSFIVSDHNTHFVVGPHLDPLTAFLMIIGIGYILFTFLRNRRTLGWLGAALLFWVAVSAIQQYPHVSNTRMFVLVPIYASLAGIGGAMVIQQLIAPNFPRVQLLFAALFVAVTIGINQLHIQNIALSQTRWEPPTVLVQQIQKSQATDQGGMPTYVVWDGFPNQIESAILNAYNTSIERVRFINGDEALGLTGICESQDTPETAKMLLLRTTHPQAGEIDRHLRDCWPEIVVAGIHNDSDERIFYRYLNSAAQQEFARPMDQRSSYRLNPDHLAVKQPRDMVSDSVGNLYALSTNSTILSSQPTIQTFMPDGSVKERIALHQAKPQAIEITSDGLLLVAALDRGATLTWYDSHGQSVRTSQVDLGMVDDLAISDSGQIFISSMNRSLIYQLSEEGQIEQTFSGEGNLDRPSTLAFSPDDSSIWVLNEDGRSILQLSLDDEIVQVIELPATISEPSTDFVIEPAGTILLTQPNSQRVIRLDAKQQLIDLWSGFKRPMALATNTNNRLYVMDPDMGKIHIIAQSLAETTSPEPMPIATSTSQSLSPLNTPEPTPSGLEDEESTSPSDALSEQDAAQDSEQDDVLQDDGSDAPENGTEEVLASDEAEEETDGAETAPETSETATTDEEAMPEEDGTEEGALEPDESEEDAEEDAEEDIDEAETAISETSEATTTDEEAAPEEDGTEEETLESDESEEDTDEAETAAPETSETAITDEESTLEEDGAEEGTVEPDESENQRLSLNRLLKMTNQKAMGQHLVKQKKRDLKKRDLKKKIVRTLQRVR